MNNKTSYYFKCLSILLILSALLFTLNSIFYTKSISSELLNDVLRLHVIANSNSDEDQNIKYIVRDRVLEYMNSLIIENSTKENAISILNEHLDDFENIAIQTLNENGFFYSVKIEIGNFKFPTKSYGNVSFPAGYYDSLRITLGEGNGENWWCVMFPPLCFVSIDNGTLPKESQETLQNNLSEESYKLITDDTTNTKIKFKIVELIETYFS